MIIRMISYAAIIHPDTFYSPEHSFAFIGVHSRFSAY